MIEPPQPAPEMKKADEKVKEFFSKLAGEDMEVDWMELKEILDYAMRSGNYRLDTYCNRVDVVVGPAH